MMKVDPIWKWYAIEAYKKLKEVGASSKVVASIRLDPTVG